MGGWRNGRHTMRLISARTTIFGAHSNPTEPSTSQRPDGSLAYYTESRSGSTTPTAPSTSPGRRQPETGTPHLVAKPSSTFHLEDNTQADLAATAAPVTDRGERRLLLGIITDRMDVSQAVDRWVAQSPLVRVELQPGR